MSADPISFLRARLDEREQVALAASPGPWKPNAEHDEVLAADDITVADGFALSGNQLRATVDHIVFWNPKHVLAEIEVTRKVIVRWETATYEERVALSWCLEQAISTYAGHPDYPQGKWWL